MTDEPNSHPELGKRVGRGPLLACCYHAKDRWERPISVCKLPSQVLKNHELLDDYGHHLDRWIRISSHTFIVSIKSAVSPHDAEPEEDLHLIMEALDGRTLRSDIQHEPLPIAEAVQTLENLLKALQAIHAEGCCHRDLHPDSIVVSEGTYKIFPKPWRDRTPNQTHAAREVVMAKSYGPRSDIYSLGLIAYEMLLGAEAFDKLSREFIKKTVTDGGDSDLAGLWMGWHTHEKSLPPPHQWNTDIPSNLSRLIHPMVFKDAAARPESCESLLGELRELDRKDWPQRIATEESHVPSSSRRPDQDGPQTGSIREQLTRPWAVAWIIFVLLLTVAVLYLGWLKPKKVKYTIHATQPGIEIFFGDERIDTIPDEEALASGENYAVVTAPPGTELVFRREGFLEERIETGENAFAEAIALKLDPAWKNEVLGKLGSSSCAEAGDEARDLLLAAPRDLEVGLALAKCMYRQTEYGESVEILERLAELPDGAEEQQIHHYLGLNELTLDNFDAASAHFRRSLEIDTASESRFYLGFILVKQKDYAAAKRELSKYLEQNPSSRESRERAQSLLERLENAEATFQSPAHDVPLGGFRRPPLKLADLRGNVVILHFWAPWSPQSQKEIPSLVHFFQGQLVPLSGRGLELVIVSHDSSPRGLQEFFRESGTVPPESFPIYLDPKWQLSTALGLESTLPQTIVLGRDGKPLVRRTGPLDWQNQELLSLLSSLL